MPLFNVRQGGKDAKRKGNLLDFALAGRSCELNEIVIEDGGFDFA
ncbi:MAG: hypothetical protein ACP5JH_04145 [Bacteroidota bacterium]